MYSKIIFCFRSIFPSASEFFKSVDISTILLQREREREREAHLFHVLKILQKALSVCSLVQKQMAILLGRQQIFLEIEDEKLAELNSNTHLHSYFLALARELDIMAPKTPDDIYKIHLEQSRA